MTIAVVPERATDAFTDGSSAARRESARLWIGYLLGRLAGLVGVVLVLVIITFLLVKLVPGDPARTIVGLSATPEQVEIVRDRLGLNDPFFVQAWHYVSGLFTGDLGRSFVTQQHIIEMIGQRLPLTASVALGGLLVVLVIGFPIGIGIAMLEHRKRSRAVSGSYNTVVGILGAMPEYITGTVLVIVFALTLQWFPVQGGQGLHGLVLPALAVGLAPAAALSRIVRNETRTILSKEYIATARSKRISSARLLLGHVLPNVATSALTMGGILLVALLGGTVIVENVFNLPGLGTQIVQSILASDYPAIQGIILTLGVLAALVNLAIDVVLGLLDPRILMKGAAA